MKTAAILLLAVLSSVSAADVEVKATGDPAKDRANILAGMAQAAQTGDTLVLRRTGPAFVLDRPLTQEPVNDTAFKLDVKGISPKLWPLVEYSGPPGSKCFTLTGMKGAAWDGVKVRLLTPGTTAFALTTKGAFQSFGSSRFSRCDVETFGDGSKGWEIGPDGAGGADLSGIVWENCRVGGDATRNKGGGGWLVHGGNTLNLSWKDCSGSFQADYLWQFWPSKDWTPGDAGGAGSSLYNCGGSYAPGLVKMAGGLELSVFAGRSEHMSSAVFWSGAGSSPGSFVVYNHLARKCASLKREDGSTRVVWLTSPPATA